MSSVLSVYLVAAIAAWLSAQLIKTGLQVAKTGKSGLGAFVKSGNMPSSHTAIMVALLVTLGFKDGVGSAIFAVTAVVTLVIVYDALNVRRAVGEQGKVLKELSPKTKFFTAEGHKISEVIAGAILGVIVALVVLQIL